MDIIGSNKPRIYIKKPESGDGLNITVKGTPDELAELLWETMRTNKDFQKAMISIFSHLQSKIKESERMDHANCKCDIEKEEPKQEHEEIKYDKITTKEDTDKAIDSIHDKN